MRRIFILIIHFFESLKSKGFVEKEAVKWRFCLKDFIHWCDKREICARHMDQELLKQYRDHLNQYHTPREYSLTNCTIQNHMAAVSAFYHWLTENGYARCEAAKEKETVVISRRDK